ncbi:hypothetical protein Hypma_013941 [Hypsizygus marmoreus]|uniref:Uncharacterized protein n=1 Tax=Hypsizygus marmoreus TaxID=39966 RepID=A0A369KEB0_HYPMA|nr:hypothetical protein Hypma_013941 [Hypsizygus marmoreus]
MSTLHPYKEALDNLRIYLSQLPHSLPHAPQERPSWHQFQSDFDWDEEFERHAGLELAIDCKISERLCVPSMETMFVFTEHGPDIEAVVDVLAEYLAVFPNSACLAAWIPYLTDGVKYTIENDQSISSEQPIVAKEESSSGSQLRPTMDWFFTKQEQAVTISKRPIPHTMTGAKLSTASRKPKGKEKATRKTKPAAPSKKSDTKTLSESQLDTDADFSDIEEVEIDHKSGARTLPLLLQVSVPCYSRNLADGDSRKDKKVLHCLASTGCHTSWGWPQNRQCILTHSMTCRFLPLHLQQAAIDQLAAKAGGPPVAVPSGSNEANAVEVDKEVSPRKCVKTSSAIASHSEPTLDIQIGTSSRMLDTFIAKGRKKALGDLKATGDNALLLFLICCAIPPVVIDSVHFKRFIQTLNPNYPPPSSSTVVNKLVPDEAAKVNIRIIKFLWTQWDLTITFNGGKIRKNQSFYSVHASTAGPNRLEFCLDLDDTSFLSHTSGYIKELLMKLLSKLGRIVCRGHSLTTQVIFTRLGNYSVLNILTF